MPINEHMSFDVFKNIVDRCSEVEHFHLTPIVGESTLNRDIYKMLDYLSALESVQKISMFTNFLKVDVDKILTYKKLHLIISIYGSDQGMYLKHTNRDEFLLFSNNMKHLYKGNFLNLKSIEFFMRTKDFNYSTDLGKSIQMMVKCRPLKNDHGNFIYELFWNGNWCGEMDVENMRVDQKEGICAYAPINNSIDSKGDIILCGACDVKKTTIIGNIFKENFSDIYKKGVINKIFKNQLKNIYGGCCASCSEFHKGN